MRSAARPLVIDASAGIPLVRPEAASGVVSDTLVAARQRGRRLLVPSLFWLEVVNALVRRHRYLPAQVLEALAELDAAGLETIELDRPALLLMLDAVARDGLSAYDATYLALAQATDAELLTADVELAAAAGAAGIRVKLVGPGRIGEARASYAAAGTRSGSWADWPGAAAYLAELRARVGATTT